MMGIEYAGDHPSHRVVLKRPEALQRRSACSKTRVLICAACGYQWNDEGSGSTFELNCPACEANMVNVHAPQKKRVMGNDYDGMPWF
jgi:hypothetical protein